MPKLLLLLVFPLLSFSQIPVDYYLTAENYADAALKYELNQIIDNHIEFSYTSSSTDVWDILKETDKDPNNPSNVILIYSGVSVNSNQEYNNGNGWTREHVWAKSRGDFGTSQGPGTDVHALRPLDTNTNSTRSNRGFDDCVDCAIVYDKWSNNTSSFKDTTDWSFEPRSEVKGDVARMLFYMAVRYEGYDGYPDLELSETIMPSTNKTPFHGILSVLLEWHRNDPVDSWEENRNDIIYYSYQDNRNPFIDHPEIAEHLWGNKTGINWPEMTLDVVEFSNDSIDLYPNPASEFININGLKDNTLLEIYDVVGRKIMFMELDIYQGKIDVSELNGIYVFRLTQGGKSVSKRIIVN
jgi:endonuclease I